jgi:hypothetical protein
MSLGIFALLLALAMQTLGAPPATRLELSRLSADDISQIERLVDVLFSVP